VSEGERAEASRKQQLLFEFLNGDLAEKRRLLETQGALLLTEDAAALIDRFAAVRPAQKNGPPISANAVLLRDCIARGVSEVFDAIEAVSAQNSDPALVAILFQG